VQKKKREQMRRKFSLKFDPSTNKDTTDGLIHREGIYSQWETSLEHNPMRRRDLQTDWFLVDVRYRYILTHQKSQQNLQSHIKSYPSTHKDSD